nr:uncharacterized protein LOC109158743 [Ipomoea batatas]
MLLKVVTLLEVVTPLEQVTLLEVVTLFEVVTLLVETENLKPAGQSAEEADLLQRSKKKTKRGLSERDGETMAMEEDESGKTAHEKENNTEENTGFTNQAVRRPAISFRRALTGMRDKYGSWMIATRKPKYYQNQGDDRRNNGRNLGGKYDNSKGKSGNYQQGSTNKFNKEGFTIWNNSRYGALEELEEEIDEENQEEPAPMERPDGPTGVLLSGKGKRPKIQITEAQVMNDKMVNNRANNRGRQVVYRAKEGNNRTNKGKKQTNQAAETEDHTVVRGYDNGNRVETTTIIEEGRRTEVFQFQANAGDHHQDPPDDDAPNETGDEGDPMADVEFTTDQSTTGPGGNEQ